MRDALVYWPVDLAGEIRRLCELAYPLEACGAIVGEEAGEHDPWCVLAIRSAPNRHRDDQRRRYAICPEFQAQVEREVHALGKDVIGYFHSHPDAPAQPSDVDRAHAWPDYLYAICSVAEGAALALNTFALDEDGVDFRPVRIALVSPPTAPEIR